MVATRPAATMPTTHAEPQALFDHGNPCTARCDMCFDWHTWVLLTTEVSSLTHIMSTYNGWTNHATWVVALHLSDVVVDIINDNYESISDTEAAAIYQDMFEQMLDDSAIATFPLLWDLLDTSSINWLELGRNAVDALQLG